MHATTALILTIGEETTGRALASVRRQTVPPAEVIVVEDVSPFHRALNTGVARVRTAFFIQVDADMVLDETCIEDLQRCITPQTGIVVGHLRDPLLGRVSSIKLFRTACFEKTPFRDTISPDTDFGQDILRQGWQSIYALRYEGPDRDLWHTFGEHRPEYTPLYTFSKFSLEGKRYRYRDEAGGLRWFLRKLRKRRHPASLTALVATAHGVFRDDEADLLRPYAATEDFAFFEGFLAGTGTYPLRPMRAYLRFWYAPRLLFGTFFRLGVRLRAARAFPAFEACLVALDASPRPTAWIALLGLCHGLFFPRYRRAEAAREYAKVRGLFAAQALPALVGARLRAAASGTLRRLRALKRRGRRALRRGRTGLRPGARE